MFDVQKLKGRRVIIKTLEQLTIKNSLVELEDGTREIVNKQSNTRFTEPMMKFLGQTVAIAGFEVNYGINRIEEDNGKNVWRQWMFDRLEGELSEEERKNNKTIILNRLKEFTFYKGMSKFQKDILINILLNFIEIDKLDVFLDMLNVSYNIGVEFNQRKKTA